ncbi:MAG: RDD family protein [Candidatus Omnitrophica bacterium]|nr:RDD family protein [Candidatus Omnitrophota bacterium]
MEGSITGGSMLGGTPIGQPLAPKGRRFAADLIDLFIVPIFLGIIIGFSLLNVREVFRSVVLVLINICWMLFRDAIFSPGRAMVGLKLKSLVGDKVTIAQAFIRNVLLIFPFVLITGYICEATRIFVAQHLIVRRVIYVIAALISVVFVVGAIGGGQPFILVGAVLPLVVCVFFFLLDKPGLSEGDRLMDLYARTRVVKLD